MAARADAGHELGALLLLLSLVLLIAGLAVGFVIASRAAVRARRGSSRPRAARPGSRSCPCASCSRSPPRPAASPGRRATPGTSSPTRTRRRPPTRRTASPPPRRCAPATGTRRSRSTPTARVVGTGAGAYATARNRYRQQRRRCTSATRTATSCQTLADLGWVGDRALAARRARLAVGGRARARHAPARPRAAVRRRARRDVDDGGRAWSSSACTRRSTGRGSCPATSCRRCCARAGSGRGRCAPLAAEAAEPVTPGRRRPGRRAAVVRSDPPTGSSPSRATPEDPEPIETRRRLAEPPGRRAAPGLDARDPPAAAARAERWRRWAPSPARSRCWCSARPVRQLDRVPARALRARRRRGARPARPGRLRAGRRRSRRSRSTATRSRSTRCSSWRRSSRRAARRPRRWPRSRRRST